MISPQNPGGLRVRTYGASGPLVIVLHGGPAAAGEAAPLARGLSDSFRVLEPWQHGTGTEPLTIARHVADLHELIRSRCGGVRPALVGESWGAMLALAYAAAHPADADPLVLVSCGTFNPESRARLQAILQERTDDDLCRRLDGLEQDYPDPAERIAKRLELTESLYAYDPIPTPEAEETDPLDTVANDKEETKSFDTRASGDEEAGPFDLRAHEQTWADMVRLQEEGVYPAAFAAITSPVLMLHGTYDPHPGRMIWAGLEPYLPQLEYREWQRCGHRPWLEKAVRDEFFAVLREWLTQHMTWHDGE